MAFEYPDVSDVSPVKNKIPRPENVEGIRISISVGVRRFGAILPKDADPAEVGAMVQKTLENISKVRYENSEYPKDPMSE